MPVLNEQSYLKTSVEAILRQEYQGPLHVVLALGPSSDRTNEVAQQLATADSRVTLVANPSGKTADGLNAAIGASHDDIIVRVDAHTELSAGYITTAIETLERTGADNVGGIMDASGRTAFEQAVAAAMKSPFGVGAASFHTGGQEGPADTVYLGVFKRSALTRVGGYDPHFVRAQDWEMNHRIRETGGTVWFNPDMKVSYRPRPNIMKLAKQYFEYGRWRRVVARTHRGTINARYLAPPFTVVGTSISLVLGLFNPIFFIPAGVYATFLIFASATIGKSLKERFYLPAILLVMHMSWGVGFLTSTRRFLR